MTAPNLTSKMLILLGDGASPEVFGQPCGAKTRDLTLTNNLGEDTVLDCDDPLNTPAVIIRHLESQDFALSIAGMVAKGASLIAWRGWADGGTAKNIRAQIDEAGADGGGYWAVSAFLGQFQLTGELKQNITFTATISGSGARTWTDAA